MPSRVQLSISRASTVHVKILLSRNRSLDSFSRYVKQMEIQTYICCIEQGKYRDSVLAEDLEFFAHILEAQKLLL